MKRSEAISNLLRARTRSDLASLYHSGMEVQVNVAQDGGDRTDGDYKGRSWHGWTDGIVTWKPFRIPHNAKTTPEENDYQINFDLAQHAEGIGMTGWNWRERQSLWVAFDFDAIVGHSERHEKKLTDAQLQEIQERVELIPWVTIRKSKSGNGLHLYVFLEPVRTENHSEHAALARAILGQMSGLSRSHLEARVDSVGGNMWVWHRQMNPATGFLLVRQGERLGQVPLNWRDHINCVSNRARRIVPSNVAEAQGNTDDAERLWEELSAAKSRVPLDAEHQKLIRFLHDSGACSWWDQDNHMLVTHTVHLREAHEKLGMRGVFRTLAKGTDYGNDHNAFLSPLRRGAWVVRRYTPGVAEDPIWDQDGNGWTRCTLNQDPDLPTAARTFGGIEHKNGGYVFREAEVALKSAEMVGVKPTLPNWAMGRTAKLKERADGKLVFEVDHQDRDRADDMEGWLPERGKWTRVFSVYRGAAAEPETGNYDDMFRHLITETGDDYGWMMRGDGQWRTEPLVHVRTVLFAHGMKAQEANRVLGACIAKPWRIVCRPFQPEVIGDRDWNRRAPQLAVVPTASDVLSYPTWISVLNHCGRGLDAAVADHAWSVASGILTGADYLKVWIASLFKEPLEPLPYLFFYSPEQNTGKSIFHEAITLLMTCGVVRADAALISPSGFNAELESAVLAVVEETDMRKNRQAYNRIKDWVTSRNLPIHRKGQTPYSVPNTTHWIHCSQDYQACPIMPGDSRVTMVSVAPLDPAKLIPKKQLLVQLQKEAPDFLASVLSLELPPSGDRLNVPVISTGEKRFAERASQTVLEIFLEEVCVDAPGNVLLFADFFDRFQEWVDADQLREWSKIKVGRGLPSRYPKGRCRATNKVVVGNLAFEPVVSEPRARLVLLGDHLVPQLP